MAIYNGFTDLPIKNSDFPKLRKRLPEGKLCLFIGMITPIHCAFGSKKMVSETAPDFPEENPHLSIGYPPVN